ncbi:uncharacterized protein LOC116618992 isoform X2 [Nematostella vectensis]|uniref:uncharacterized protein LOC116618992 isoform X2 n=1 Tax=Nematostella vectensis TaxID=45351 RepID=UPI002077427C|nr:uncharacterized protein LOC116618992 isoform X2 [Nematostella vectensis]
MAFLGVSSGTYDLPCSCKTKTELSALNELLGTDEKIEKKSHAWSEKTLPEAAKQDEGLWAVYGLLSFEDRNTRSQSGKQVLLTAWQVCDSSRDHEGGYLMNYDESKRSPSKRDAKLGSSRSRSSSAREPKNLETFTRRCDFVKENIKPQTNQECERQEDGRISRLGRSASPHKAMKFHHFKRITEHMRYYRETITASATRRHVQIQVQKSKKAVKPPQAHSKAENMTFCKFCVSTTSNMNDKEDQKNGFGILRVSPCLASPKTPSKNTKDKLSQKEANKLREEIKSDSFNSSASRKTLDIPKKETVLLRRSEKCRFSISSVAKNYSEGKASPCTMLDYEKKLILSPSCRDFVKRSVPDEEKKTSEIRPVKKVELQVCRPPMLSVGNGNGKGRGYGACYSRRCIRTGGLPCSRSCQSHATLPWSGSWKPASSTHIFTMLKNIPSSMKRIYISSFTESACVQTEYQGRPSQDYTT